MRRVLQPALAGTWYPESPNALRKSIERYLAEARLSPGPPPKAIVAPHAGYIYSGPVAGSAYAAVQPIRERIRRVVLAGPSHRVYVRGLAAPSFDAVATPLGEIALDAAAIEDALSLRQVTRSDAPFLAGENSLELQYPFLQVVLSDFTLVPLAVGDSTPEEVAEVLLRLWNGPETLIVASSDLSHYLPYDEGRRLDASTSEAIERLDAEKVNDGHRACGHLPVAGLLLAARVHGLRARTLDLRSSGDTAGPRDEVVGYGAYAFA